MTLCYIFIRFKSRDIPNKDLCEKCYIEGGGTEDDYMQIDNVLNEMTFHQYFACK